MTESENERHRLLYSVPKCLPPFDCALVDLDKKGMLKLLLSVAPDSCQILTVSSSKTPLAKYFPMLLKRNFRWKGYSLEFPNDLILSGRVVNLFVRRKEYNSLSPLFFRGESCLHEMSQAKGTVIDLYFGGLAFHKSLQDRLSVLKSIVVLEEQ